MRAYFSIAAIAAFTLIVLTVIRAALVADADIERDIQTQRAQLCAADGWPADAKAAYERACRGELRQPTTLSRR
ncbi:hypothetical protein [Collimonas humicola]|uniref:hypothetical protein n=1 Tax=Collimonas humicola TaxID=2825886 RepID=UPI001B8D1FA7|nr:hypothetical protein [Collimonas humicola]